MASGQLDGVLQHIRRLVAAESPGGGPDRELLERFVRQRDEAAFAALVRRHGAMVLGVCRRVLPHVHDAEDACQATFLVLARKSASIRKKDSLGCWLHGVAYRVASALKRDIARRRSREQPAVGDPPVVLPDLAWREVRAVLDEELGRLPERFRAPLLLCYLEGKTRDEAAQELGWSLGTLRGRLERGRDLLRARLTRRGLGLSGALLAALLTEQAASAAPAATLVVSTVQAALSIAAGQVPGTGVVSARVAGLVNEMMRALTMTKVRTATAGFLAIGLLGLGAGVLFHGAVPAEPPGGSGGSAPRAGAPDADEPAAGVQPIDPAQLARNQAESRLNLKKLALAMHNFHDTYTHFPAPAIYAGEQPGGGPTPGMLGMGAMGAGGGPGMMAPMGGGPPGGIMPSMKGAPGGTDRMAGPRRGGMRPPGGSKPPGIATPPGPGGTAGEGAPTVGAGSMGPGAAGPVGGTGGPTTGRAGKPGKALLSWRVAILPYLGEHELYKQFKLDEPWDGPHNRRLLRKMPKVYAPPGGSAREPYSTYYQVFVGEHAAFERHQAMRIPSFTDGTSNTLLIVEAGGAVPWTKPEDLHFSPDDPIPELGGLFPRVFHGAMADGSVHAFSKRADPEMLRKLIMRDDGLVVDFGKVKVPATRREAELRQVNARLQEQLDQERRRLEDLRGEKELLDEMTEDPASQQLRQENAELEKQLRQLKEETDRLRQEIQRLKRPAGQRPPKDGEQ
jgi:RNA polymerase sigma factor (sigma-70 family)